MRTEGNLVGEEVNVGDIVTVNREMPAQYRLNTNMRFDLTPGQRFTVTRVNSTNLTIRTVNALEITEETGWGGRRTVWKEASFSVDRMFLMFEDANYVPPPPPRKLGKMPTREELSLPEDVELIGIDHPGIQWLWNDMGRYAEEQGYCNQYDALCVKLGIPGRPRDFEVRKTINGVDVRATIKARSQREANELFAVAISGKGPSPDPESGPETTPPDPDFSIAA